MIKQSAIVTGDFVNIDPEVDTERPGQVWAGVEREGESRASPMPQR
ncbi:hypothetical protein [Streptomyces sp. x-19]